MSRHLPWLVWGIAIGVLGAPTIASAQSEPVKPYVVLILDTSGSMDDPGSGATTGFGPPSCPGTIDTKEDHAKCAIFNLANSYGEMVLGLGRFRSSVNLAGTCGTAGECGTGNAVCNGTANGDEFQLLVPLVENNQADVSMWTDFTCTTCDPSSGGNPEIYSQGATPLAGSLEGAKLYWQGQSSPSYGPYWTGPGDDPIFDDPLKTVFNGGEQCRPYITILLTDGDETCASITQATNAATALLTTTVDGLDYRIETKPIGFGKTPGDAEIEAIAHAGGAVDDGDNTTHEGAYAQNEEELQLEISRIIADALKFEACNGADDDCDLAIDEDFVPPLGDACDDGELGICLGTGTFVCNAAETGVECVITDPGLPSTTETCNGDDDDCDGTVDEGVCVGCTGVELCNNVDDDCDGATDEDLVRQCGTDLGICDFGTEICTTGTWGACSDDPAPGEVAETCNGLDDDCDGTVDGFAAECSDWPGGNPDIGPCHPGTAVCPADGSGVFGTCIGEVAPVDETCDLIDNDCDGTVDEATGGEDCSGSCGVGTTVCIDGALQCDSMGTSGPDDCNGFDEDCDGFIDEDYLSPGACTTEQVCNGTYMCISGNEVCVGESIEPEICNCENDDCDAQVDEGTLCAPGATCVDPVPDGFACQCAEPCAGGEFPCSIGRVCVDGFCLVDPCAGVDCPPEDDGDLTECVGGACVRSCDLITCPTGTVCVGSEGQCRPDDCTTFPDRCTSDEVCVAGECVSDPCAGVTCPGDEYCTGGECYGSCAGVECPDGQRCRLGVCEDEPCPEGCPGSQVCNEASGECMPDPCQGQPSCPEGEWCDPQSGDCETDPCVGVTCPAPDQVCVEGTCFGPGDLVDAGVDADVDEDHVSAAGGGGCQAGGGGGGGGALLLVAAALALRARRRREVAS